MSPEISHLLKNGSDTIVQKWTEKVSTDRRVTSDARLSYLQLVDHIPQIVEELRLALASPHEAVALSQGREHGRQRWRQGYELKEVVRELTLLRATLTEFLDTYRGALSINTPEQISQSYGHINRFIDEEIYKTVEAYVESPGEQSPDNGNGNGNHIN